MEVSDSDMTGKWHVCKVNLVHNHDLSPESLFLIPAFRYIPIRYQNMLEYNEDQGMAPGDNIEIVFKIAGLFALHVSSVELGIRRVLLHERMLAII